MFSLTTPTGICIGAILSGFSNVIEAIFLAFSAGM